jgi:tetratricopeptide (TPR) repeat protein
MRAKKNAIARSRITLRRSGAIQKTPLALINSGNAYLMMKDYDYAIADFDTVIRLDPTRRMPKPPAPVLSSERVT